MQPTQTLLLNLLVTLSLALSGCQSTTPPTKLPTAKTVAAIPPSLNSSGNTTLALAATAPRILPASWSPDGNMLAYWTFTADEVKEDFKLPPGTLHYFDLHTRQSCIAPEQIGYGYFTDRLFWLATDEVFLVTVDHQVVFGAPCTGNFTKITALFPGAVDIIAANPDHTQFVLESKGGDWLYTAQTQTVHRIGRTGQNLGNLVAWSPSGQRLLFTSTSYQVDTRLATTTVVDLNGDQVTAPVQWEIPLGEGAVASPFWLNEDQFLIQATLDQEPLLVTIGQPPVQIAPTLFGVPPGRRQWAVALMTGTNNYHLAFSSVTTEEEPFAYRPIQLYHAETNKVDELPFQEIYGFSPDGKWLLGYQGGADNVWLWPVDGLAGQGIQLPLRGFSSPLVWKPDSSQIAVGGYGGVTLFDVPGGTQTGFVKIGDYSAEPFGWSPDGKFMAIRGIGYGQEALFVVQIQSTQ